MAASPARKVFQPAPRAPRPASADWPDRGAVDPIASPALELQHRIAQALAERPGVIEQPISVGRNQVLAILFCAAASWALILGLCALAIG